MSSGFSVVVFSHLISPIKNRAARLILSSYRLRLIVRVNVVLNRIVVVDSDWRFDNLRGSHLQSQSEFYHVSWWYYTLVIDIVLRCYVYNVFSHLRQFGNFTDLLNCQSVAKWQMKFCKLKKICVTVFLISVILYLRAISKYIAPGGFY